MKTGTFVLALKVFETFFFLWRLKAFCAYDIKPMPLHIVLVRHKEVAAVLYCKI